MIGRRHATVLPDEFHLAFGPRPQVLRQADALQEIPVAAAIEQLAGQLGIVRQPLVGIAVVADVGGMQQLERAAEVVRPRLPFPVLGHEGIGAAVPVPQLLHAAVVLQFEDRRGLAECVGEELGASHGEPVACARQVAIDQDAVVAITDAVLQDVLVQGLPLCRLPKAWTKSSETTICDR